MRGSLIDSEDLHSCRLTTLALRLVLRLLFDALVGQVAPASLLQARVILLRLRRCRGRLVLQLKGVFAARLIHLAERDVAIVDFGVARRHRCIRVQRRVAEQVHFGAAVAAHESRPAAMMVVEVVLSRLLQRLQQVFFLKQRQQVLLAKA